MATPSKFNIVYNRYRQQIGESEDLILQLNINDDEIFTQLIIYTVLFNFNSISMFNLYSSLYLLYDDTMNDIFLTLPEDKYKIRKQLLNIEIDNIKIKYTSNNYSSLFFYIYQLNITDKIGSLKCYVIIQVRFRSI